MTVTTTANKIVTAEQVARCERIQDLTQGHAFYIVRSQTDERKEYKVEAILKNGRYHVTCTCPAGLTGCPCWHKRAAAAAAEEFKATLKAKAQAQAKIDEKKPIVAIPAKKERIEDSVPRWMLTAPVAPHMKHSPREF